MNYIYIDCFQINSDDFLASKMCEMWDFAGVCFLRLMARPLEGGWGNRLKGPVSGERLAGYAVLITLRAVDSDLEFAAPRDADLPDAGRAYVEHVATPDPLRERPGGSQTSSELAMACVSAHRAKRTWVVSIASESDEASMAGAQGCLPAKSARERAIGIERSRISEKIVKRS